LLVASPPAPIFSVFLFEKQKDNRSPQPEEPDLEKLVGLPLVRCRRTYRVASNARRSGRKGCAGETGLGIQKTSLQKINEKMRGGLCLEKGPLEGGPCLEMAVWLNLTKVYSPG